VYPFPSPRFLAIVAGITGLQPDRRSGERGRGIAISRTTDALSYIRRPCLHARIFLQQRSPPTTRNLARAAATVRCLTLPRRSCPLNSPAPIDDAALVVFSTTERRNPCSLTSEPRLRSRPRGRRYVDAGVAAPARWYAPRASAATRVPVCQKMHDFWRKWTLADADGQQLANSYKQLLE
jgi:hypothetical protein